LQRWVYFILWFGWFGFNPGSQLGAAGNDNTLAIAHIVLTTNLAAAGGAVSALICFVVEV
jgi:ammonium transporter, Amt family